MAEWPTGYRMARRQGEIAPPASSIPIFGVFLGYGCLVHHIPLSEGYRNPCRRFFSHGAVKSLLQDGGGDPGERIEPVGQSRGHQLISKNVFIQMEFLIPIGLDTPHLWAVEVLSDGFLELYFWF